jgi:hypothetical protein
MTSGRISALARVRKTCLAGLLRDGYLEIAPKRLRAILENA